MFHHTIVIVTSLQCYQRRSINKLQNAAAVLLIFKYNSLLLLKLKFPTNCIFLYFEN